MDVRVALSLFSPLSLCAVHPDTRSSCWLTQSIHITAAERERETPFSRQVSTMTYSNPISHSPEISTARVFIFMMCVCEGLHHQWHSSLNFLSAAPWRFAAEPYSRDFSVEANKAVLTSTKSQSYNTTYNIQVLQLTLSGTLQEAKNLLLFTDPLKYLFFFFLHKRFRTFREGV